MNIPNTPLDQAKRVMVVGLGGGFDVFGALPLVYGMDKEFILVNSSMSDSYHYIESTVKQYPEGLIPEHKKIIAKYTVGRYGAQALRRAYEAIMLRHDVDGVLGIDGGVDCLCRGDEENPGTILEDFNALCALQHLDAKALVLCCVGFGTETEESLNHYRVLENISNLIRQGAFYGSFSLTKHMPEAIAYKASCDAVWEYGRKSHIQTKIISALEGSFGCNLYDGVDAHLSEASDVTFVSALSSIYWFFDLALVVRENHAISSLKSGNTFVDAKILLKKFLQGVRKRTLEPLPL